MTVLPRCFGFSLRPKSPYNFELTVHKPAGWPLFTPLEVFEKGTLWTALHIGDKLTGLRLRSKGTVEAPKVLVEVFRARLPSQPEKREIRDAVTFRLGADQDLADFYGMARKDPILKHAVSDLNGLHDTEPGALFSEAALSVLLQMAPLKRSLEMMDCLIRSFGDLAKFDRRQIHAWPTPEKIAGLDLQSLGPCRLGYRAKRLLALAGAMKAAPMSVEELKGLPPGERKKRLLGLPGIGDYSADIISGGFPIDAWSADVFGKLFFGREPEDGRAAIESIKVEGIKRWGRHAWMAFLYVVQDLENLSKKLGTPLRLQ